MSTQSVQDQFWTLEYRSRIKMKCVEKGGFFCLFVWFVFCFFGGVTNNFESFWRQNVSRNGQNYQAATFVTNQNMTNKNSHFNDQFGDWCQGCPFLPVGDYFISYINILLWINVISSDDIVIKKIKVTFLLIIMLNC